MSEITVFLRHAKRSHNTELDLSNKQLSFIPKQLFSMRNIESLNLSHNKIQYIDTSITELSQLQFISRDTKLNSIATTSSRIEVIRKSSSSQIPGTQIIEKLKKSKTSRSFEKLLLELEQCKGYSQTILQTPLWLRQSDQKEQYSTNAKDLEWNQSPLRYQKKFSRKADRRKIISENMYEEPESTFKNGVLEIKFSDLKIGEQISMGGFSTIHKGFYMGSEVAIKKIFNPSITEQLMAQFNNEISMLSKYRHPKIVLLIGAVTCPPTLCIVMELIKEGTLYDFLHKRKVPITEQKKTFITRQILEGIQFLHNLGIVHRDIKSHNILLNSLLQVKICDFGLARHKSELNTGPMQYSGTPTYMTPQLFLKKAYDQSVDIFALGTMLYEIYSGEIPYQGIDPADIREKVLKDSSLAHRIGMKKSISQIINKCRHYDPKMRPNINELLEFTDW